MIMNWCIWVWLQRYTLLQQEGFKKKHGIPDYFIICGAGAAQVLYFKYICGLLEIQFRDWKNKAK